MKKHTIIVSVLSALFYSTILFSQTLPHTINYQGVLKDASGVVVTNGDYNLTFKLYDVEIDGSALWSETKSISITDGIINTQLGDVTPIDLPFEKEYWLEIKVGTESELTPRIKLSTVPYSYTSMNVVDGSITAEKIKSGEVVKSINSLTDGVTLVAGNNVSITPSGNNLTISSSGSTGFTLPYDGTVNEPNTAGLMITHTASDGINYGFFGKLTSSDGAGVQGEAPYVGVLGNSTTASGNSYGVWGLTSSQTGIGVYGHATNNTGNNYGVYGRSSSLTGYGVWGEGYRGVVGITSSPIAYSYGVFGQSKTLTGTSYGIYGVSASSTGIGIYGLAESSDGTNYGVYGRSLSTSGIGVYGEGKTALYGETEAELGYGLVIKCTHTSGVTRGVNSSVSSPNGFSGYFAGGKFTITSSKVGIGTVYPNYQLDIAGVTNLNSGVTSGVALRCNGDEALWYDGTYFSWGYGGTANYFRNKIFIGSAYQIPTQMLDVNGNARFRAIGSGAYYGVVNRTSDGTLTISSSDVRLKENIHTLQNSLDKVMKLRGVSFNWKTNPEYGTRIGFIAQEFETVIPELVFTNEADGYKGINYAEVTAVLVEAVKELKVENDKLRERNEDLLNRLEKIEKYLNQTTMK